MKNINITVENKRATVVGSPVIICGNSDYTVTFDFDDEWNLTGVRTARFVYVKDGTAQHEDKVFEGNTVAVPVLSDVTFVNVGVFAGDLCTTTPARVNCRASILCGSGAVHEPTPDVYAQIMALFNEMAEKGAFGATEAQAQQIEQNRQDIEQHGQDLEDVTDRVTSLEDGTTPAGDASKLGGDTPDHFATAEALAEVDGKTELRTSILEKALAVGVGVHEYTLSGSSYSGDDLPYASYGYGSATIYKRSTASIAVVLWGVNACPYPSFNYYNGTTWTGWNEFDLANYLPLTGGILTGSLRSKVTSGETGFIAENDKGLLSLIINGNGTRGLYSSDLAKWFIYANPDGAVKVNGTASGNLPLTGGTVSKAGRSPIELRSTNSNNVTTLYSGTSGTLGELGFIGVDNPTFRNTSGVNNTLLHTGNSAKVHIDTSAPSDTTALWIDTSA